VGAGVDDTLTRPALKPWQYDTLLLVAAGADVAEMARYEHLSQEAIKSRLKVLTALYGVMDRTTLAVAALRRGDIRLTSAPWIWQALSPRQCELLQAIADHGRNATVAEVMGLSPLTVKSYLEEIKVKTGDTRRTNVVVRAYRAGLIQ